VFVIGDKVFYPQHGAGIVVDRQLREVLGEEREYLTIRVLASDMTVMVPVDRAEDAGLRSVVGPDEVEEIMGVLRSPTTPELDGSWAHRFRHNLDRMRSGDVMELAGVIRHLVGRSAEKPLSAGEKQMLARAKTVLASELMFALDLSEEDARAHLDDVLAEVAPGARG
jgi:CarD family transcriptional regulator